MEGGVRGHVGVFPVLLHTQAFHVDAEEPNSGPLYKLSLLLPRPLLLLFSEEN